MAHATEGMVESKVAKSEKSPGGKSFQPVWLRRVVRSILPGISKLFTSLEGAFRNFLYNKTVSLVKQEKSQM